MSDIHVGKPAYTLFIWISVSPRAAYWVEKSVVETMAITKPSGDVRRCVFRYSSPSIGILNGIWHASCSNSSSWLLSVPAACDHGRRKIGEFQVKCRYLQKQQKLVPIEKPQFSQLIFYFSIVLNLFVYLIQINFFKIPLVLPVLIVISASYHTLKSQNNSIVDVSFTCCQWQVRLAVLLQAKLKNVTHFEKYVIFDVKFESK